jgi:hypothetical protein
MCTTQLGAASVLSPPTHPGLSDEQITYVTEYLLAFEQ